MGHLSMSNSVNTSEQLLGMLKCASCRQSSIHLQYDTLDLHPSSHMLSLFFRVVSRRTNGSQFIYCFTSDTRLKYEQQYTARM